MSDDSSSGSDNEQEKKTVGTTIADDLVVTKYKMASEITNRVLKEVMEKCQANTSSVEVCTFGDQRIAEETEKVFKKEKNMKKGT
jgi:methionine aminopeptidase